ncbi:SCO family protein [Alcaligenaceae bacterium SJ-26]|nr:SCO family protein [Alcaligenaceae bacterium SJ-26]
MKPLQKTLLAIGAVLLLAVAALYPTTRGFQALTADTARRVELAQDPRPLPSMMLVDQYRQPFDLQAYPGLPGRWTVATLVYTQCTAICRASATGLAYIQEALAEHPALEGRVQLLTLSFDPARDTPEQLDTYARQLRARADIWRFATVTQEADLLRMLNLFDIIVLPDRMGGYDHNAGLFLINPEGRIMRAYDVTRPDLVLADLLAFSALAP